MHCCPLEYRSPTSGLGCRSLPQDASNSDHHIESSTLYEILGMAQSLLVAWKRKLGRACFIFPYDVLGKSNLCEADHPGIRYGMFPARLTAPLLRVYLHAIVLVTK